MPHFSCLYCLWELTNIGSSPSSGLRATGNHKSPLRWKKICSLESLLIRSHSCYRQWTLSVTTPKFLKSARRKASRHNIRGQTRQLARWAGVEKERYFSPRACKNPSLVSDCLILHHVSDSNMGFILYNYPSHGNDCISSFRTDNSIWTQVIRFLGCGWYLSIICPVKREGMAGGFLWLLPHEILPPCFGNLSKQVFFLYGCAVHLPVPSSPQPLARMDGNGKKENADMLLAFDKVQKSDCRQVVDDDQWLFCGMVHFKT